MKTQIHSLAAPALTARSLSHFTARRACPWAALGILAAFAFGPQPARAAVTEAWVQRYNGPANYDDSAQAVVVDGSGNVVVTGYSLVRDFVDEFSRRIHDYYTAKYAAADGALLWEKRYNGPANDNDFAQALAVDGSGNVLVTGSSHNGYGFFYYDHDYYTAKYAAADGALLWEKRYNGPANNDDHAQALAVDGSGNVVVTGYSYNANSDTDYYTAKYAAADGALLWEQRYNGPGNPGHNYDFASAVAVDGSGNVVVTGVSDIRYNDFGWVEGDYYTVKYAAADGVLLWEKHYNGPANSLDSANAVAVDGSGNVIVTGYSNNGTNSYSDYYTAKYAAANGALLWEKRYNGNANSSDRANAVAVDDSGNVVVTGSSSNGTNADCYTAKYAAADGALLWEQRHNGPGNGDNLAYGVVADGSGNVVVTGYSYGGSSGFDYYTAKYAAVDGALLWEQRYNGPANGDDRVGASEYFGVIPRSLALGPNGMLAITGSSIGSSGTDDYATVVYRELPPPLSFAGWAACSGLTGAAAAADADPDSDGLPNGAEYILGGIPTVPGTSGSPAATTSGGNIILTFPRDDASETPDVTLTVETGTNLLTWPAVFHIGPNTAASSPGVSITENGTAPDTITVTIPQGKAARLFARMKVTVGP